MKMAKGKPLDDANAGIAQPKRLRQGRGSQHQHLPVDIGHQRHA